MLYRAVEFVWPSPTIIVQQSCIQQCWTMSNPSARGLRLTLNSMSLVRRGLQILISIPQATRLQSKTADIRDHKSTHTVQT